MSADPFAMLAEKYRQPDYLRDVKAWARDKLGVYLWSKQDAIAQSVQSYPKTLVRSCHDSGKTFTAAVVVCHHIDQHPIGTARVVSTAPSSSQVRGLLWNEINKLFEIAAARGNPLPGRVNQTEWWIGSFQAGIGRKPSDYKAEAFSGWHAEHMLVVVDEADGVPATMLSSTENLLTNAGARGFYIGNPDDPTSEFKKMQERAASLGHNVVKISAWDTPNFSGEEVPDQLRRVLLSRAWVEERRVLWGGLDIRPHEIPDHPFWASKVEAEYPDENDLTIVRIGDVEACRFSDEPMPKMGVVALGIDVAGSEAGDWSVVRERVGNAAGREWTLRTSDPEALEDFFVACAIESGATRVTVDVTGVGFGFVSGLRKRLPNVAVVPFHFGSGPQDKEHFLNARAEVYWMARMLSRNRKWNLAHMENAEDTLAQLVSVRRVKDAKKIQVEDKKEVVKRIGRSPDHADALLLAFEAHRGSATDSTVSSPTGISLPRGVPTGGRPGLGGQAGMILPTRTAARR